VSCCTSVRLRVAGQRTFGACSSSAPAYGTRHLRGCCRRSCVAPGPSVGRSVGRSGRGTRAWLRKWWLSASPAICRKRGSRSHVNCPSLPFDDAPDPRTASLAPTTKDGRTAGRKASLMIRQTSTWFDLQLLDPTLRPARPSGRHPPSSTPRVLFCAVGRATTWGREGKLELSLSRLVRSRRQPCFAWEGAARRPAAACRSWRRMSGRAGSHRSLCGLEGGAVGSEVRGQRRPATGPVP